ncbi:hypothetical protein BGZ65_011066 [Modicella reniformis]|uniref:Pinin/SDK/MemA protein domain-containing protein n=1 Tax=Modicella reniformis TaxID=1440133 RepID=A0A9P6SVX3_9FUNG|nr:hypothetical protein BGZ65_011066 [Modicella reniformis]
MEAGITTSESVAATAGDNSTSAGQDETETNEGGNEDVNIDEDRDRTKRARTSLNPVEDKRGRRMMGMILGTLTQFKKQESFASGEAKSSGMASREALQERVREKLRKEQELNAELRKKEKEEREERLKQQQANRQAVRRPNQRRNLIQWENGYLVTETRPRLRYMPKVMNDELRRKHEAQIQETGEGAPQARAAVSETATAAESITTSVSDPRAESAAGMDLDVEDVAMEVVVDVKDVKDIGDAKNIKVNETPASIEFAVNDPALRAPTVDSDEKGTEGTDQVEDASKGLEPAVQFNVDDSENNIPSVV